MDERHRWRSFDLYGRSVGDIRPMTEEELEEVRKWTWRGKYLDTPAGPIRIVRTGYRMTLEDYQKDAHGTAKGVEIGDSKILYPLLGMAGEVGELINKVKKIFRDGTYDEAGIRGEIGDILWYVAEFCTQAGLSLESVAEYNLEKLRKRKEDGTIHGSGDNR